MKEKCRCGQPRAPWHNSQCRGCWNARAAKRKKWLTVKQRARNALRRAVLRGAIKRGRCENHPERIGEGHHEDYSRPLAVRWLCGECHRNEHRKKGRA